MAKKPIEGAVIVEGIRPRVQIRNSAGVWVNGTPIWPKMREFLEKDGYTLRAATETEEVTEPVPVIPSVNDANRPGQLDAPRAKKAGKIADSQSTALDGDGDANQGE